MIIFFCKQKTAYEMLISDWSSDVCSSDLSRILQNIRQKIDGKRQVVLQYTRIIGRRLMRGMGIEMPADVFDFFRDGARRAALRALERHMFEQMRNAVLARAFMARAGIHPDADRNGFEMRRSEEHTSELQSLMRISYAVFCLKKKKKV